jgi:hypothetical protein
LITTEHPNKNWIKSKMRNIEMKYQRKSDSESSMKSVGGIVSFGCALATPPTPTPPRAPSCRRLPPPLSFTAAISIEGSTLTSGPLEAAATEFEEGSLSLSLVLNEKGKQVEFLNSEDASFILRLLNPLPTSFQRPGTLFCCNVTYIVGY